MSMGTTKGMRVVRQGGGGGSWGDDARPSVAFVAPPAVIADGREMMKSQCAAPTPSPVPVRRLVTPSAPRQHPPRLRLPRGLGSTLFLVVLCCCWQFLLTGCASSPVQLGSADERGGVPNRININAPLKGSIVAPAKTAAITKDAQPAGAPEPAAPGAGAVKQAPSKKVADGTSTLQDKPSPVTQQPPEAAADSKNIPDANSTTVAGKETSVAVVAPAALDALNVPTNATTDSTTAATSTPTTTATSVPTSISTSTAPKPKVSFGEKVPIKKPKEEENSGHQIKAPPGAAVPSDARPPGLRLEENNDMEGEDNGPGAGADAEEEDKRGEEMLPPGLGLGGKAHDLVNMGAAPREAHMDEKARLAVDHDDGQNHAFGYFVVLLVGSVALIAFWRKRQRILAYLIEGRRSNGRRRTGSRAGGGQVHYRKLTEED